MEKILGGFRVLVVPSQDSRSVYETTIPRKLTETTRVVAMASNNAVEAAFWAFTPLDKRRIVESLRSLANFLETNGLS